MPGHAVLSFLNPALVGAAFPKVSQFASLYQSFADLTVVRKQYFEYWFAGRILTNLFQLTVGIGSGGSGAVQDAADVGYRITISSNDSGYYLNMGNKRNISAAASEILGLTRRASGNTTYEMMGIANGNPFIGTVHQALMFNRSNNTFIQLRTSDGTLSSTDSAAAVHTNFHLTRLVMGSSDVKYYENGVLEVTKTTNRPTAKQQPVYGAARIDTTNALCDIKYAAAWNI